MPAGIFDKGAAAFNPVSVVEIKDIADLSNLGMVNMAAHHPVHAAKLGLLRHDLLEAGDVLHRVLDLVFQEGRQRPVGQAQPLAHGEQQVIEAQRPAIGPVAGMGQPLGKGDNPVKAIAMQHPQPSAVGGFVDRLVDDFDAAE